MIWNSLLIMYYILLVSYAVQTARRYVIYFQLHFAMYNLYFIHYFVFVVHVLLVEYCIYCAMLCLFLNGAQYYVC